MQESLVDFIEVKQLNATNIMKEFLTVLLRGFGVFPLPNPRKYYKYHLSYYNINFIIF